MTTKANVEAMVSGCRWIEFHYGVVDVCKEVFPCETEATSEKKHLVLDRGHCLPDHFTIY
jgi:hypothetical protein